jgi:hypothetical protein
MRHRLIASAGCLAAVAAVALVGAQSLAAQTPAARPKAPISRLADGHPDLQGVWDIATMTPLDRPAGMTKLVLTPDEVRAMEAYEAERTQKGAEPSDPNRAAPPVGGDRSPTKSYLEGLWRAGGGVVGGYNNFWIAPGSQVITVDGQKRSSIIVDPVDGHAPAMRPEAQKRNIAFLTGRVSPDAAESAAAGPPGAYDGPEARPLAERCLLGFGNTSGPPTLPNYFYNNLKQIVQTKDTIMILVEMVHDARIIRMNATHLPSSITKWMGDSIGRWESDTLVVDTTNFTNKTQFRGSAENLHVVERFTRVDDQTILYRFTVDDPTTWERSWTGEYPWRVTAEPLYEYACHEGNYALTNVLKGARVGDADQKARQ